MVPNEVIIIGGGKSVEEGLSLGLKNHIKDKFVIALNYSYKFFDNTFLCFGDSEFYKNDNPNKVYPNIYEELKTLPLIVGMKKNNKITKIIHPNTLVLPVNNNYCGKDGLKKGFYSGFLSGLFSISIGIYLMDFKGTIFLLGYDWSKRTKKEVNNKEKINIHYYKGIVHRGSQWTDSYEKHNPEGYFKSFLSEKEIKIYNVNPNSNILTFEKINYKKMFELLSTRTFEQDSLREFIKIKLLRSSS